VTGRIDEELVAGLAPVGVKYLRPDVRAGTDARGGSPGPDYNELAVWKRRHRRHVPACIGRVGDEFIAAPGAVRIEDLDEDLLFPGPSRLVVMPPCHGETAVRQRSDRRVVLRWSRLSEQIFRVAKWSLCRG
jgi:hypothetical protein